MVVVEPPLQTEDELALGGFGVQQKAVRRILACEEQQGPDRDGNRLLLWPPQCRRGQQCCRTAHEHGVAPVAKELFDHVARFCSPGSRTRMTRPPTARIARA